MRFIKIFLYLYQKIFIIIYILDGINIFELNDLPLDRRKNGTNLSFIELFIIYIKNKLILLNKNSINLF